MPVEEATVDDFPSEAEVAEASTPEHSAPEPEQPVSRDPSSDYDFDDSDEGESDPPAEPADSGTEPADSGVVSDGESFPPELLKLTNLDEKRARAAFGTPDRLEQAWLAQVMNAGREADLQRQRQLLQQHQPQQPSSPQSEAAPTQQELEDYLRLKLELPEEFADVEDNKLLFDALSTQVSQFYGPHFKRLEENFRNQQEVLAHFLEREQREQWARHDEEFDRFISDLPDEWHELLGKERPEVGTPQHQARAQLFHAKSMIENGSRQQGHELSLQRALELGLRTAFPEKHDTIIKGNVTSKRQTRSRIARPTHRTASALSPEEEAANAIREFKKSRATVATAESSGDGEYI